MTWTPQTNISHYEYGAGSWSRYYWDPSVNPNATPELCLANCTTLAYGRVMEEGYPAPVTRIRNANLWHTVVNEDAGWTLLNYYSGMLLMPGDILEWSAMHVAVVETQSTSPYVSASWYTPRDESLGLQGISNYFQTTDYLQYRFYHYVPLWKENNNAGDGLDPVYVLRYTGSPVQPIPEVSALPAESYGEIDELATSVDFRISVTVSNIPSAESVAGNLYCDGLVFTYESNWTYGSYTIDGVLYRYATKTVDLRYTREHNYAYSTVKYLTFNDTFSTGSVSLRSPIRIDVTALKIDDIITILKATNKKKCIKHIIKI